MSPQPSPYHTALGFIAIGISLLTAVYVMNGHSKQSSGNIAFVDFAAVMQESQAGKSINEQVAPNRSKCRMPPKPSSRNSNRRKRNSRSNRVP